ncbi:MAG TPA: hypothetical protein VGX03_15820 [Candidatus Binatia bacterium]|jgi:hypothetical protein|nr:hypothetical protein [Candidatus Binatia bacterium]
MMHGPAPEQYGLRILKVCRNYSFHAGEQLLPLMLYIALLFTNELQPEDVTDGLHWLVENGYLELRGPLQSGYTLTPKGAAALYMDQRGRG